MTAAQIRIEPQRIPRDLQDYARALQRRGLTLQEISEYTKLPRKAVEQSLYWDVVAR
jgi:hypothetical protein